MDINDLKSVWQDADLTTRELFYDSISVEESMNLKHSKIISKALFDVKLKVFLSILIFFIYVCLMLYALVYLRLNLSLNSLVPLVSAGIFLLINATSYVVRLLVLTKTADNLSVRDSMLVFNRKLNRIKVFDFIFYIVFFYLSAILIIINYLKDIGGAKNILWGNGIIPAPLLGILILLLLSVPWFIRYQNNRRYKKLFYNLNEESE